MYLANVASNTGSGKNVGLFRSLANGAKINNLILNVSTPAAGLAMNGHHYFGGLVGIVNLAGEMLISGVTVNGKLKYASLATGWLVVGGLFGGMQVDCTAVIKIESCVSNLEIEADIYQAEASGGDQVDFGGLVGCKRANVIIKNSYTTGKITVNAESRHIFTAGGLVADNVQGSLSIENCYASGDIALTKSSGGVMYHMYAGGLVGFSSTGSTTTISNSAALNESVTVNGAAIGVRGAKRILGSGSVYLDLQDNYALSTMKTGVSPGGEVTGAADDANGLGKTLAQFKSTATWGASGLGFDQDIWDFSTIAEQGWPVLKN
jgi:hypothetical protein